MKTIRLFSGIMLIGISFSLSAQSPVQEKDTAISMKTYPYFDPNPVPNPDNSYYPYFRYEGFSDAGTPRKYYAIQLENDYIRLIILPEIGGKIWGAVEKSTGKEFIYFNHVVKFREISMRGPWTSGGIEANFGIIGHAPFTSTPVDYFTRKNKDGSISCFIGKLDMITRSWWTVEINLQKDKAYFTTRIYWHNTTPLDQPYYHWMNAGYKASGDLQFIFPGANYIGHGGDVHNWPVNESTRDVSWYNHNDFGVSKSYHVLGGHGNFYGAYWHSDDFGSGHYAAFDDKLGKKIWIWALSRQGAIWEDLLTDTDGQYVELQSGRLFNQAASQSSMTPFKHPSFAPYGTDSWTEYWFPVNKTQGMVKANQWGALNVINRKGYWVVYFCPLQNIQDEMSISVDNQPLLKKRITLHPMQTWVDSVPCEDTSKVVQVTLGTDKMTYSSVEDGALHRPLASPADFNWNSAYGLYIKGKESLNQNHSDDALDFLTQSLKIDPYFVPALNEIASLYYRMAQYDSTMVYSGRALSIDTYDADANFLYGIANLQKRKFFDAGDAFSIAALSPSRRPAAYLELAKIAVHQSALEKAMEYALKSLDYDRMNPEPYILLSVISEKMSREKDALDYLNMAETIDPMNHFIRFEHYWISHSAEDLDQFKSSLNGELPWESYLEMALWYKSFGFTEEAEKILSLSPKQPMVQYHHANVLFLQGSTDEAKNMLDSANAGSSDFVFPFRSESIPILAWASSHSDNWKPLYYLGLIYWHLGNKEKAKDLFAACKEKPDIATFYLTRASLDKDPLPDLLKAESIQTSWRTGFALIDYYMKSRQYKQAYEYAEKYRKLFPDNYRIGLQYAGILIKNGQYDPCIRYLKQIQVLPYEGAQEGREVYHEACLQQAFVYMKLDKLKQAIRYIELSKLWPENLGVGKPYDNLVDERLENFMLAWCYTWLRKNDLADKQFQRTADWTPEKITAGLNDLLQAIALQKLNKREEANKLISSWPLEATSSNISEWCRLVYAGKTEQADKVFPLDQRSYEFSIVKFMLRNF